MYIVHVNSNVIRSNAKHGDRCPPLTVRDERSKILARGQEIVIPSDPPVIIRYNPDAPLECGARVWIETAAVPEVRSLGDGTFTPATRDGAGETVQT